MSGIRLRHARTGEELPPVSGREALERIRTGVWEVVDPTQPVAAWATDDRGNRIIRPVPAGELLVADSAAHGRLQLVDHDSQGGGGAFDRQIEGGRQEVLEDMSGTAFAQAALDTMSFGGASALQNAIDPTVADTRAGVSQANPTADLLGVLASLAITGGAGAVGRTGAAGVRAATGLMGLGEVAGQGMSSLARGAITRAGISEASAISRYGPRIAGLIGEEAAVSTALETSMALRQNREFSSDILATDVGLGVALGFGTMGLFGLAGQASQRFSRRANATPSSRTATEGITDARELLDAGVDPMEILRRNAEAEGVVIEPSFFSRLRGGISNTDAHHVQYISNPQNAIRAANAPSELPALLNRASDRLDNVISDLDPDLHRHFATDDYLRRHEADFSVLDINAPNSPFRGAIDSMLGRFDEYFTRADGTLRVRPGVARGAGQDALELRRTRLVELRDAVARSEITPQEGFTAMRSLQEEANLALSEIKGATAIEKRILGDVGQMARDNVHSPEIWGDSIASTQASRDQAISQFSGGIDNVRAIAQQKVGIQKMTSAKKLRSIVGDDARDFGVHYDSLNRSLLDMDEALERLEVAGLGPPEIVGNMRGELREAASALAEGADYAKAHSIYQQLEGAANKASGGLNVFGGVSALTGAGAMALAGSGPVGMGVGGLMGFATMSLTRPGGTSVRLAQARAAMGSFGERLTKGLEASGKALRTGLGGVDTRGIRHGVKAYYNFEGTRQERQEEFTQIRNDLLELQSHPALLEQRMAITSAPFADMDKGLGTLVAMNNMASYSYLVQALPAQVPDPLRPQEFSIPPSQTEIDAFIRKYRIVSDPLLALERFSQGQLTVEESEALRVTHAPIYGQIVAGIAGEMSEIPSEQISYQAKVQTGILFGIDTHITMSAQFNAAMQNQGAQTEQQHQANTSASSPSMVTNELTRTQQTLNEAPL